jgi:hypothetical protein
MNVPIKWNEYTEIWDESTEIMGLIYRKMG